MVSIVTGKINTGKTTFMLTKYLNNPIGDGFISMKTMADGRVKRYDALHLSTWEETLLVIHEADLENQEISCQIGPYCFLKSGLQKIENTIEEMIEQRVEPIYLDEIGQLELQDQGFSNILKKMIESNLNLILSIREDLIDPIKKKYCILETETINQI